MTAAGNEATTRTVAGTAAAAETDMSVTTGMLLQLVQAHDTCMLQRCCERQMAAHCSRSFFEAHASAYNCQ